MRVYSMPEVMMEQFSVHEWLVDLFAEFSGGGEDGF